MININKFKEDSNYKFKNPICSYEIFGRTPLDCSLRKDARWYEFYGYLNYNNKSKRWSIQIKDRNSLDYRIAKYGSIDLKETLEKLKTKCFKELDYIRNVKLENKIISMLLKEIEKGKEEI